MTEVLSQAEIDQLLRGESGARDTAYLLEDINDFEKYLLNRKIEKEKPYGIFDKDVSVCRFFEGDKNENLLEDIMRKNKEQGQGNIKIPNTDITLINYSFCQNCSTIFSFKELTEYYRNPKPDPRYTSKADQYRQDTRVYCHNCGAYFLPSLVIADKTPENEVQFLCRVQTINAVEKYFDWRDIRVLSRKQENLVEKDGRKGIKNDVYLKRLDEKPTLIANIIQYTPFALIMNLIDGSNVEKGDLIFDEWKQPGGSMIDFLEEPLRPPE